MKTYGIFNSHSIQALKYTTVLKVLSGDNKSSSCQRIKPMEFGQMLFFILRAVLVLQVSESGFLGRKYGQKTATRLLWDLDSMWRIGSVPANRQYLLICICPDHIYIVIYLYKLNQSCQYWSLFKTQPTGLLLQFVGLCQFLQSMISPTLWDFFCFL